jgi:hypothetical protein
MSDFVTPPIMSAIWAAVAVSPGSPAGCSAAGWEAGGAGEAAAGRGVCAEPGSPSIALSFRAAASGGHFDSGVDRQRATCHCQTAASRLPIRCRGFARGAERDTAEWRRSVAV